MTPEDIQKYDQAAAFITDSLPPACKNLYDGFRKEGFDDTSALRLVLIYINAISGGKLTI